MIKEFEDVRNWGELRGINKVEFQTQYQRVLQEVVEIHDAYNKGDMNEVSDAIGDTIVTLINLAKSVDMNAEDCLRDAFSVIELRKGLTFNGDFVKFSKLNNFDKEECEKRQGHYGSEYFLREDLDRLTPADFKK